MSLTDYQRGRVLERLASILHEELSTDGLLELAERLKAPEGEVGRFVKAERDRMLRRAARLLGGEASTQNGLSPSLIPEGPDGTG